MRRQWQAGGGGWRNGKTKCARARFLRVHNIRFARAVAERRNTLWKLRRQIEDASKGEKRREKSEKTHSLSLCARSFPRPDSICTTSRSVYKPCESRNHLNTDFIYSTVSPVHVKSNNAVCVFRRRYLLLSVFVPANFFIRIIVFALTMHALIAILFSRATIFHIRKNQINAAHVAHVDIISVWFARPFLRAVFARI